MSKGSTWLHNWTMAYIHSCWHVEKDGLQPGEPLPLKYSKTWNTESTRTLTHLLRLTYIPLYINMSFYSPQSVWMANLCFEHVLVASFWRWRTSIKKIMLKIPFIFFFKWMWIRSRCKTCSLKKIVFVNVENRLGELVTLLCYILIHPLANSGLCTL